MELEALRYSLHRHSIYFLGRYSILNKRLPVNNSTPKAAAPKKRPMPARPTRPGLPKRKSKSSLRPQVATLPQPAFFKLPADFPAPPTQAPCRLQLERSDGSRLTLTLPGFDLSIINSLVADFLWGGRL